MANRNNVTKKQYMDEWKLAEKNVARMEKDLKKMPSMGPPSLRKAYESAAARLEKARRRVKMYEVGFDIAKPYFRKAGTPTWG